MQQNRRNYYLDMIRIVFTLYIIIMHAENMFRDISNGRIFEGGYLGVEFFFIICGFYLLDEVENKATIQYLIGRLKKLYPHYFLSVLVMYLWAGEGGYQQSRKLFQNLIFGQYIGYVESNDYPYINGVVWYVVGMIVASTILYLGARGLKKWLFNGIVIFMASGLMICILSGWSVDSLSFHDFYFVDGLYYRAFGDIAMGILARKVADCYHNKNISNRIKYFFMVFSVIVILYVCLFAPHRKTEILFVLAILIYCVSTQLIVWNQRQCRYQNKWIGLLYPIYCYQMLGIAIYEKWFKSMIDKKIFGAVCVVLCCVITGMIFEGVLRICKNVHIVVCECYKRGSVV